VRLFVAVWPPDEVAHLIDAVPRPEVGALRWTTSLQWHVTVRFLGGVGGVGGVGEVGGVGRGGEVGGIGDVDRVAAALGDLSGSGVAEAVLGPATAWFPGRRVLQVPVSGLEDLESRVGLALSDVAHLIPKARDREPGFRGHLTLARVRGRGRLPSASAEQLNGIALGAEWPVHRINLVASRTGAGGSTYTDVAVVDL
jgi:2'-5' RNA ligase